MTSAGYGYDRDTDYQPADDDFLESVIGKARKERKQRQEQRAQELDRLLKQSAVTRQRPVGQYVHVRHEGWWRRKNKEDQARANVAKGNEDLAAMEARVSENICKLAVHGHFVATRSFEFMHYQDQTLPEDIRSYGQVLNENLITLISKGVHETATMYFELSCNEIGKLYQQDE
jgi:hypothetical protein